MRPLSQWSGRVPWSHDARSRQSYLSFQCFSEDKWILWLEHYWCFMLKTKDWFHTSFDMFLKDCNGTFRVFVWMKCLRLMKMDYWAEHANNKWLFGHKWWNKSVIYCRTGIPGSAFWWRSSKVSDYLWCCFLLCWLQNGGNWAPFSDDAFSVKFFWNLTQRLH